MSIETVAEARTFLDSVFACLLNPNIPARALALYFSADYRQEANGQILDFDQFLLHADALKATLETAFVQLEEVIVQGPRIADVHTVRATKKDGSTVRFKVIALYLIEDGKISNVRELTQMLEGQPEDEDLGFRTVCAQNH